MPILTSPKSNRVKTRSSIRKPAQKIGTKIRALEEQLAQRDAEIARLLKETEQRATELQIINNIGQTLTEGLDLQSTLERVGDRLRETLKVETIGISVWDEKIEHIIARYSYRNGKPTSGETWDTNGVKLALRLSARGGGRSWVVNRNVKKAWRKFGGGNEVETPKSFVQLPLLAGGKFVGGITIADYEREDAFTNVSIGMLETIASNLGTAIQNARLFGETQRLLKQTKQRATELQIINNIGQTLTEGLDLNTTLERVGERLREVLDVKAIAIVAYDPQAGLAISNYIHHYGRRIIPQRFSMSNYKYSMRFALKVGSKPWVVNTNVERYWKKFGTDILTEWTETPKAFVIVPMLAGRELVGSITIADYEDENAFTNFPIGMLETISSNMGTAIQNVRLFEETQRLLKETEQRATELQIINNIGQTLTEGGDLENMIQRVGERIQEALSVNNIAISIFDKETERVIAPYMVRNGKQIKLTQENYDLRRYKMLINAWARAGGRGTSWVINKDIDKLWRKGWLGTVADDVPKSLVALPLLAGGEIIGGILLVDYEKEDAFTDLSVNLLETIASNMGTAVQNVRLFDETQRLLKQTEQRATELAIINNVQAGLVVQMDLQAIYNLVGEKIRNLFDAQTVDIAIYDPVENLLHFRYTIERGEYFPIEPRPIMGFRKHVIESRQYLLINDLTREERDKFGQPAPIAGEAARSVLFVPMVVGEEVKGVISLQNLDRTNAFSDADVRLLQTFANSMTVALENARLFDETQRLLKETEQRATELQIINDIGQTLAEGGDLRSTIQRVGEKIQVVLNVSDIVISVFDEKADRVFAPYMVRKGKQVEPTEENFDLRQYKLGIRASARAGGTSWVVNTDAEKYWQVYWSIKVDNEVPKSLAVLPLLAGREVVGGIGIADYEKENAFTDLSVNLLETIASNMGTAIQNVRLFDETKKLFKEAEEARAAAEQANKAKSTFLANMSHELRTPLNAIIGFTRIVKKKADGALPEKQIENLDKVLISSEHLLGLINTVLDIAKIEAGRMDVVPSKFSLSTLADQCATLATPLLKPNVTLENQADETLGLIFSDQDKIKQIVLNLLSNAAKFTHAGSILLSVQKVNDENVNISVTDSGIGISKEALGRIFEEFQQADTSTTREYGGTGLGLAISRNLARLLGGDLIAASELGKGSTFILTLPIQYGKKPALSEPKSGSTQSAESQVDTLSTQQNDNRDSLKTILIVEDTELNINLLTQLLEDDYNLLIAKDGVQGVSMAQQNNPDLILMDISLPIMDGYEATRRIRETEISIPIIGLSAHAMSGDTEKAKEAGCNDYMTKPVDEALLIKKLNQYLR